MQSRCHSRSCAPYAVRCTSAAPLEDAEGYVDRPREKGICILPIATDVSSSPLKGRQPAFGETIARHPFLGQSHLQLEEAPIGCQICMDQNLLDGIAGCRVVDLGVDADALGGLHVHLRVDVDMADAIGMAQDRDAGVVLDVRDQLVGAARNHLQTHTTVQHPIGISLHGFIVLASSTMASQLSMML